MLSPSPKGKFKTEILGLHKMFQIQKLKMLLLLLLMEVEVFIHMNLNKKVHLIPHHWLKNCGRMVWMKDMDLVN